MVPATAEPRFAGCESVALTPELQLLLFDNPEISGLHISCVPALYLRFNGHFLGEPGLASVY